MQQAEFHPQGVSITPVRRGVTYLHGEAGVVGPAGLRKVPKLDKKRLAGMFLAAQQGAQQHRGADKSLNKNRNKCYVLAWEILARCGRPIHDSYAPARVLNARTLGSRPEVAPIDLHGEREVCLAAPARFASCAERERESGRGR